MGHARRPDRTRGGPEPTGRRLRTETVNDLELSKGTVDGPVKAWEAPVIGVVDSVVGDGSERGPHQGPRACLSSRAPTMTRPQLAAATERARKAKVPMHRREARPVVARRPLHIWPDEAVALAQSLNQSLLPDNWPRNPYTSKPKEWPDGPNKEFLRNLMRPDNGSTPIATSIRCPAAMLATP